MAGSKKSKYIYLITFAIIFFCLRIPRLQNDTFNTDAVYWHGRSQDFINAIKSGNFAETYQKYHPGVTTMWLTSLSVEFASLLKGVSADTIFANPPQAHYYIKTGFVIWQFLLSVILFFLFSKIWNKKTAFFGILLFSIEPFYLGNSRILHHDVAISLYLLIAFSFSYLYYKEKDIKYALFTGLFLSLAVLTKTLFLGALLFVLGTISLLFLLKKEYKGSAQLILGVLFVFVLSYVALFPAMWVEPIKVIKRIFTESYYVGNEAGHKQIFFGETVRDPGPLFYIVLLGLKLSLVSLIGFLIYCFNCLVDLVKRKKLLSQAREISFETYITIFYLGYFLALTFFSKKVDRYIVPFIPFISLIAVLGYTRLKLAPLTKKFIVVVLGAYTIIYPLIRVFPHYLTYTNPIFGDAADSNEIIGQKLFGIGVYDLRDTIIEKYGETKFAMHDPGPMQMIYDEEKVFDISKEHPNSYSYIVLGPNKEMPENFYNQGIRFPYKTSIVINGLEFWRIYKIVY